MQRSSRAQSGTGNWEFDDHGLMRFRIASINDLPIQQSERKYYWPLGRRPDDHPSLSELGLRGIGRAPGFTAEENPFRSMALPDLAEDERAELVCVLRDEIAATAMHVDAGPAAQGDFGEARSSSAEWPGHAVPAAKPDPMRGFGYGGSGHIKTHALAERIEGRSGVRFAAAATS